MSRYDIALGRSPKKFREKSNVFPLEADLMVVNEKEGYMDLNKMFWPKNLKLYPYQKKILYNTFIGKPELS